MDSTTLVATLSWVTGVDLSEDPGLPSVDLDTLTTMTKTLIGHASSMKSYEGLLVLVRGLGDGSVAPLAGLLTHYLDLFTQSVQDVSLLEWEDLIEATLAASEVTLSPLVENVWHTLLAQSHHSPRAAEVARHALYALQDYPQAFKAAVWREPARLHPLVTKEDLVEVGLA